MGVSASREQRDARINKVTQNIKASDIPIVSLSVGEVLQLSREKRVKNISLEHKRLLVEVVTKILEAHARLYNKVKNEKDPDEALKMLGFLNRDVGQIMDVFQDKSRMITTKDIDLLKMTRALIEELDEEAHERRKNKAAKGRTTDRSRPTRTTRGKRSDDDQAHNRRKHKATGKTTHQRRGPVVM